MSHIWQVHKLFLFMIEYFLDKASGGEIEKKAFTLVELMVVMGIMAVLTILGVSTWISLRNTSSLDNASESILTTIQETQNKAIAISSDSTPNIPKLWAAEIEPSTKTIYSDSLTSLSGSGTITMSVRAPINETVLSSMKNVTTGTSSDGATCQNPTSNPLYINYSTPFGFATAVNDSCDYALGNGCASNGWTSPTATSTQISVGYWYLANSTQSLYSANNYVCIQLTNQNNKTETIFVSKNGDAYVKK